MLLKNKLSPTMKASIFIFMNMMILLMLLSLTFNQETMFMLEIPMMNYKSMNWSMTLTMDKITLVFSITVLMISLSVMVFSTSYMSKETKLEYFVMVVLLFVLSMNMLIFIPNLMMLLIGWDGLGLTSYLLVIYYSNNKAMSAGMITALTNRIGDALLILAISWALMSGHWSFSFTSIKINIFIVVMIILAAMTKSAQMPFSAWLPAAMAAPTPVSALVHSSTLVTAGVYLIIRFFPTLSKFEVTKFLCFYMGAITCLMASTSAIMENDLKKIIALSTLSQLGIMMMALGLEQPHLAFFHMITHALFKALLFICAGTIIHLENNNQDIRLMGNLEKISPATIVMMNTANLSLCGTPFLAGFYSKDSIIETFFTQNNPLTTSIIMISSICLTSAYTMRLSMMTMWSANKTQNFSQSCSKFTYLAYFILISGAILGGTMMNWMMMPITFTPTLPKTLKYMALLLILMFAVLMYNLNEVKPYNKMTMFLSSMWFLSYLSSNTMNKTSMNMGKMYLYNESTWMEKFSGKGIMVLISKMTKITQNANKMTMSEMLTNMMFIMLLVISMYPV